MTRTVPILAFFLLSGCAGGPPVTQQDIANFNASLNSLGDSAMNWQNQLSQQTQSLSVPTPQPITPYSSSRVTYTAVAGGVMGSNGVTYRQVGQTIIGSDGTTCQQVGESLICR